MPDNNKSKEKHISEDDARGGLSSEEVSGGDTLLPMLIGLIVLTVVGLGAAALFVFSGL